MAMVIANEGKQLLLRRGLNYVAADNCILRLFRNDVTPTEADTTATYTEANYSGYAAKTLTGASWTVTSADPAVASYADQAFVATGGTNTIYGWYMTNAAGTILIAAERFAASQPMLANNDTITIQPRLNGDTI